MLRVVDTTETQEIVKSSNNHTGVTNFYGVRGKGAKNQPFDETFPTLGAARGFAGVSYNPPVCETMSNSDCAEIQERSNKGKRK